MQRIVVSRHLDKPAHIVLTDLTDERACIAHGYGRKVNR
jgi:hypothetical protein